jgi:hypothetical protein
MAAPAAAMTSNEFVGGYLVVPISSTRYEFRSTFSASGHLAQGIEVLLRTIPRWGRYKYTD